MESVVYFLLAAALAVPLFEQMHRLRRLALPLLALRRRGWGPAKTASAPARRARTGVLLETGG